MNWQILQGDTRDGLRTLPELSVHTCVTSPPYWGLRDYGHAGQIGLEQTPEQYAAQLVEVFREVRRVLRDDGTLWVNLGDSYAAGSGLQTLGRRDESPEYLARRAAEYGTGTRKASTQRNAALSLAVIHGLKPKDLIGIPWRVAFALQADGWYLRSDIIWAKPNPMPESVTDRPTKGHEYLFLLAKQPRYYYDAAAIAEEAINAGKVVTNNNGKNGQMGEYGATRGGFMLPEGVTVGETRNRRTVWTIATQPFPEAHFATFPEALVEPCIKAGSPVGGLVLDPFSGSGTTGVVALKQGRSYVGCELNPEYVQMSRRRIGEVAPLLAREVA